MNVNTRHLIKKINCNDENVLNFIPAEDDWHYEIVDKIRNDSDFGKFLEVETFAPPCTNGDIIKNFKIGPICDLIRNVSVNKDAFLRLMKYTKQSPVYMEDRKDYINYFIATEYGYTLKNSTESRVSNK